MPVVASAITAGQLLVAVRGDAECAEAYGQVPDPLWWCPVIRQREAGFAEPQHVAEGLAPR
jgi:hypothetical protein